MNTLKYLVHHSRPYRGKDTPAPDLHYWGVRPHGITRAGVLPCAFQGVCLENVDGLGRELQFWVADPVLGEKPGVVWLEAPDAAELKALVMGIVAEGGQIEPALDWLTENPIPVHETTADVPGKRELIRQRIATILGLA